MWPVQYYVHCHISLPFKVYWHTVTPLCDQYSIIYTSLLTSIYCKADMVYSYTAVWPLHYYLHCTTYITPFQGLLGVCQLQEAGHRQHIWPSVHENEVEYTCEVECRDVWIVSHHLTQQGCHFLHQHWVKGQQQLNHVWQAHWIRQQAFDTWEWSYDGIISISVDIYNIWRDKTVKMSKMSFWIWHRSLYLGNIVHWAIISCLFLLPHVYCFTMCVLLSYIL